MKFHSCGAILYTIYNSKVYIILGKEHGGWFPFKGRCESGETFEQAAVREIKEETCNLISLDENEIKLDCNFSTSRKHYHIGLVFVPYSFIKEFYTQRHTLSDEKFLEKTHVKMFNINTLNVRSFHQVTSVPVLYYYQFLKKLQEKINKTNKLFPSPNRAIRASSLSSWDHNGCSVRG